MRRAFVSLQKAFYELHEVFVGRQKSAASYAGSLRANNLIFYLCNMKTEYDKSNLIIHVGQILFYIAFMLIPSLVFSFENQDFGYFWPVFEKTLQIFWMLGVLYFLNFYLLVPRLLFAGEKIWFAGINILLILFEKFRILWIGNIAEGQDWASYYWISELIGLLLEVILIFIAISVRYLIRWNEMQRRLQEERRKAAEAELTWLKNQLNPHFLFNTLNNISSLVQINPDEAQENIARLSDLLRYALYDSNGKTVPLKSELEFLRNYIDLMRLRSGKTTINIDIDEPTENFEIIPLLFISPVENAFKHTAGHREPSIINIFFKMDKMLYFAVENTYFATTETNHIGSGIGVENLRRRLELAYPGRYKYTQRTEDGIYHVSISIWKT